MSEGQDSVEKTFHRVKGKYYELQGLHPGSHPEWHRNVGSEKRAKKTVEQFMRISSQDPLATFFADSESTIDLKNYEPGTIIRIEKLYPLSYDPETPSYGWFVLGDRIEDSMYVYGIFYEDESSSGPKLPINGKLQIFAVEPIKLHSFAVRDTEFVLTDNERLCTDPDIIEKEKEEYRRNMPIQRVDIMSMGKPAREKSKERIPQKATSSKLATESAS